MDRQASGWPSATRKELAWGGALLAALAVAVVLLLPRGFLLTLDHRLSTYRATPDGAAALFQTLAELDLPVERRLTPLRGAGPILGPLAVLAPAEPLTPREVDVVIAWVEGGGRLVVTAWPFDPILEDLGLATRWIGDEDRVAEDDRDDPEARGAGEGGEADRAGHAEEGGQARPAHPWVRDLEPAAMAHYVFDDCLDAAWAEVTVLRSLPGGGDGEPAERAGPGPGCESAAGGAEQGRAVVLLGRRGAGEVLAVSDPWLLSNAAIAESGIAPLLARAVATWTAGGGALWFDEYHHGYRSGSLRAGVRSFLLDRPAGRTTLHLALVALLGLAAAAARLGRPVRAAPPARRSPVEHVTALGEAYRHAGADAAARRRLLAGFARRIGRQRPRPGEEAKFLERIELHVPSGGDAVAAVAAAWRDQADILELSRRIDRAVTQLSGER